MTLSHDHYIYAAHMRRWATDNRVTVLRRGEPKPKPFDIGIRVAAEQGLNDPSIEAAYGRIEDAFNRALVRLLEKSSTPTDRDWNALRAYAVLVHDRYPRLRGSATSEGGLPGGNMMMAPNPALWGNRNLGHDNLSQLATVMRREQLKAVRLQLLPVFAQWLPPVMQVFYVGPMLLGDAGIHAITLHPDGTTARSYVAMPLSPDAMIVFGRERIDDAEVSELARLLTMKIAMESTIVVDTLEGPIIKGYVGEMWSHQSQPSGEGIPAAVHVYSRISDIPTDPSA